MANTYQTDIIRVTTTGSITRVFIANNNLIVRDVMIYAVGGAATVSVLYDDLTNDEVVAKESLSADETWRPFTAPIAMNEYHEIKVNTSAALTILITYVEFS